MNRCKCNKKRFPVFYRVLYKDAKTRVYINCKIRHRDVVELPSVFPRDQKSRKSKIRLKLCAAA